jgi:hypothetical protein
MYHKSTEYQQGSQQKTIKLQIERHHHQQSQNSFKRNHINNLSLTYSQRRERIINIKQQSNTYKLDRIVSIHESTTNSHINQLNHSCYYRLSQATKFRKTKTKTKSFHQRNIKLNRDEKSNKNKNNKGKRSNNQNRYIVVVEPFYTHIPVSAQNKYYKSESEPTILKNVQYGTQTIRDKYIDID